MDALKVSLFRVGFLVAFCWTTAFVEAVDTEVSQFDSPFFVPGNVLSCYHSTPIHEYDRGTGAIVHSLNDDVDSPFLGKFDDRGYLFVTDRSDDEVLVFGPDGMLVAAWPTGPGTQGIDLGWTTGRIYVATSGKAKVFENDGTLVNEIPYDPGFWTTDLAVDEDRNRIYLSTLHSPRIVYVADFDGNEIARWNRSNGVSDSPWGIDVGLDGTVYVGIHHGHKVVAISPNGVKQWEASSADLPRRVSEVEVAPNGEIWVQEEDRRWIARFDPAGLPLPRFGTAGPSGYMIAFVPESVDMDGDGVPDDEDSCPRSILGETIVSGACDSGVANILFEDGCTMQDLLGGCMANARNRGAFVSCAAQLLNGWIRSGLTSGREKGRIQKCLAPADVDFDGDVDGQDFAKFSACFNGAGRPPRKLGCPSVQAHMLDFDDDHDIDGADFGVFASCFNKAGNPPRTLGCPWN